MSIRANSLLAYVVLSCKLPSWEDEGFREESLILDLSVLEESWNCIVNPLFSVEYDY